LYLQATTINKDRQNEKGKKERRKEGKKKERKRKKRKKLEKGRREDQKKGTAFLYILITLTSVGFQSGKYFF
jgi:ribosomal protein S8E